MRARRYTFVIADRSTGVVRQLTLSLRPAIAGVLAVLSLPVLIGLGARWSALVEIDVLRQDKASLEIENASYRTATDELTTQIQALQTAVSDLGARATLDPRAAKAMDQLSPLVKRNAAGGSTEPMSTMFSSSMTSPEDTFGLLRGLLEGLESRLRVVQKDVERRQARANATPSVWPVYGWLSGSFGRRSDPFTGEAGFHRGLDISADKGQPVYATAAGKVDLAGYSGDYGNLIVLNHGYGLTTRYGHLSRFAVKLGAPVKKGDIIGYVGSTGRSTGSHLHYEVLSNGKLVNPLRLLTANPR